MATISLTLTLTRTRDSSNPKLNRHKLPFISCRATTGTGTTSTTSDFYKILSLKSQEADIEEIKKAYRIMALKYHPDVCTNNQNSNSDNSMSKEESTRKFLQVHAAYRTLSDPVLREEYDKGLMNIGFMGYKGNFRGSTMEDFDGKKRWRDQLDELKKKSAHRTAENGSSWASRMRSRN
ncbi:Chaperone protein DnaJ [Euphorbia peplus]|nr:Chaperone protein DnaJ [Euphorbia peplus]